MKFYREIRVIDNDNAKSARVFAATQAPYYLIFATALAFACMLAASRPAHAESSASDKNAWVSIDDYAARAARTTPVITPASPAPTSEKLVLATPQRPLELTTLPGRSDTHHAEPVAGEDESDIPEPVAHSQSEVKTIRLTTLPSSSVSSVPGKSATRTNAVKPEKTAEVKTASNTTAPAVCEGSEIIKAARKKQLDAIEGDSKTAAALQSAIEEMGLQKKLNFVNAGTMVISAPNQTAKN